MSENGTIHITMMKNWVSHILFLRKADLSYTWQRWKNGGYSARTYIGSYPYPPPPPPPLRGYWCLIYKCQCHEKCLQNSVENDLETPQSQTNTRQHERERERESSDRTPTSIRQRDKNLKEKRPALSSLAKLEKAKLEKALRTKQNIFECIGITS